MCRAVPQRETGMTPYEIMLSESQERMLLVVKPGREAEVERIFDKWDLHASHIGEVTGDGMLRVKERGVVVAEIPNGALTDEAPLYHRPMATPEISPTSGSWISTSCRPRRRNRGVGGSARSWRSLDRRRSAANGGCTVSTTTWCARTRQPPGMGAGVVRIKETGRALAMSVDGNGRYCTSTRGTVRCWQWRRRPETSRVRGASPSPRPTASTSATRNGRPSCGSWHRPSRALAKPARTGHADHRRERQPVQRDGRARDLSDAGHRHRRRARACRPRRHARFQAANDVIVLLGEGRGELGGSEYLKMVHGIVRGVPPALDLAPSARCRRCSSNWRPNG